VTKYPSNSQILAHFYFLLVDHKILMKNLTVPPSTEVKRQRVYGVCDKAF